MTAADCPCHTARCREDAMVVLDRDEDGVPTIWCDPCIAPIVKALNDAGLRTVASCCGHGGLTGYPGGSTSISLADGREVIIRPPAVPPTEDGER